MRLLSIDFGADKCNYHACGWTCRDQAPSLLIVELELHPDFVTSPRQQRYLVGVSGGRDSVVLLQVLLGNGFSDLVVCHLNHGLRGEDSEHDATFVKKLAEKHHLAHEIVTKDVKAAMDVSGESMELAARNLRHLFFAQCAEKYGSNRILLGHHADDNVETILFNLLRGSAGLKGIQLRSQLDINGTTLEILRPLLKITRAQIDRFADLHSIAYREDTSNAQPVAARNRLRNEAIPLLEDIMERSICPALVRAEKISMDSERCVKEMLEALDLEDPQDRIFLPKLAALPHSAQLMAIQIYLKKNNIPNISHRLLEECQSLVDDLSISKVNLPGSHHLCRRAKRLLIE